MKEFEKLGRELCQKIFEGEPKFYEGERLKNSLTAEEAEIIRSYGIVFQGKQVLIG